MIIRLRRLSGGVAVLVFALALGWLLPARGAQPALFVLAGSVRDVLGQPLPSVSLSLRSAQGKTVATARSDAAGAFRLAALPAGHYALGARLAGYQDASMSVELGGAATVPVLLTLASEKPLTITVLARRLDEARNALSPQTGTSSFRISGRNLADLPQGAHTPLNQVLLQAPGVAQDSYGQVHVRGEHANLQYRINGIQLPEGISGFGQTLDTRFVQSLSLLTGVLPAQYGERTAGVVEIRTHAGALERAGYAELYGGSHGTLEPSVQVQGSQGRFSYFLAGSYLTSDLGVEAPTPAAHPLHDHTTQGKGFAYLSWLPNPDNRLVLMAGSAVQNFQIPNNPDQVPQYALAGVASYPSARLDETQRQRNHYAVLALQGVAGPWGYQLATFARYSSLLYQPDPIGDLVYNGVAARIWQKSISGGLQGDVSRRLPAAHTLRFGFFLTGNRALSDNTSAVFPADAAGNQLSTAPITVTDNHAKTGWLYGAYLQDEWRVNDRLTLNFGLRADAMDAYTRSGQLSPRLNGVYRVDAATTIHAGYARYFTPPPLELIASKDLALFAGTTNQAAVPLAGAVKPERAHYFDIGVSRRLGATWEVGLDAYYKLADDVLDEGQFGQALIATPFNYSKGKIYGVELTNSYLRGDLSAYLNVALSRSMAKGVASGEFNFDQDELDYINNHWVHTDHDQLITASGGVGYPWKGTTWSADGLFATGLRNGFANTGHQPAYFQLNLGAWREFTLPGLGRLSGRVSIINVFDRVYQIRDGSGIGVFAPQYGPRRAFYMGVGKRF